MEPTVIPGSFASPTAIAHLAVQKYVIYSPLYRSASRNLRKGPVVEYQLFRVQGGVSGGIQ